MAFQRPNAVGLFLCRMVIVEEKTRNVTLANCFRRIEFDTFPSPPSPMQVYAVLTDGLGENSLELVVTRCATLEEIYGRTLKVTFQNPLRQLRMRWQLQSCSFPFPGAYEFGLQANGEKITQSVIQVATKGATYG